MTVSFTQSPSDLGAWTYSGMRAGPDGVVAGGRRGQLLQYGNGVPYSSIFSYSFMPAPIAVGNITTPAAVALSTSGGWIPLTTSQVNDDSVVTPYYGAPSVPSSARVDGTSPSQLSGEKTLALQFEAPCCVQMTCSASPTGSVKFTVFGYDLYGQPVQALMDSEGVSPIVSGPSLYGVTGIWCHGGEDADGQNVVFSTTQSYGLPYKLNDICDLIGFGIGTATTASKINPLDDVATAGGAGSQTSDARGVILPQADFVPDSVQRITLTYFVKGGHTGWDVAQNAISRGHNPSHLPWTNEYRTPNLNDLFGVSPFYVGYPV